MSYESTVTAACEQYNNMVQYPYAIFAYGTAVWLGQYDVGEDEDSVRAGATEFLQGYHSKKNEDVMPDDRGFFVEGPHLKEDKGYGYKRSLMVFVSKEEVEQHGLDDDDAIMAYADKKKAQDAANPRIIFVHRR